MKFSRASSWRTIILALLAVGLVALALGGYLAPAIRVVVTPLVGVQTWLTERYTALVDFVTAPRDVAELTRRNAELEAEVARLSAQVIELQQQNQQIDVLSALVEFARDRPAYDYVAADVIGRDPSPFLQYVIINRGSDDGLRRGMPVVTAQGLVGRIAAVTAGAARVQLITDASSVVNISLQSSEAAAVLLGSLTGELTLTNIPQDVGVEPGELLLTSGLGGNFPPNILIGQVTGVRSRSFELFQTASVQPVVDFARLEIVLIIRNFRPVDITPLIPEP
ncbi:MAG TPA: rod shape-determining protein MreC [Anaerolineales bacterium]|nr:rod shape-determining protein MreC [Anaerolineales bacterium]